MTKISNRIIFGFIASAIITHTAFAAPALKMSDLSIAGIEIGQSKEKIIQKFGAPKSETYDEYVPSSMMFYNGLEISIYPDENTVSGFSSISSKYCTKAKLCPGDSVAKVKKIYGNSKIYNENNVFSMEYGAKGESCWFEFELNSAKSKVNKISVLCAI